MKKLLIIITTILSIISCTNLDEVWEELRDHEERIQKLEALCNKLNSNIEAVQTILAALQQNDYVTDIVKVMEDGVEMGYSITFAKGGTVTIYHGSNGADGAAPKVSIRKAQDGEYYWTADGEWMTDENGEMIPASVSNDPDGKYITPLFRVAEGIWYVSYDNGNSWREFNKASEDDVLFSEVTYDEDFVYLTLADGTQFKIPTWKAFEELQNGIIAYSDAPSGNRETFTYTLDTGYDDILSETDGLQNTFDISEDIACIQLPSTYTPHGTPTKLIFINHGAGHDYTGMLDYKLTQALLSAGFATLHVRGIPKSYQNDKYISGGYSAPCGSPIWIRSAIAAYNYVTKKYNIDKNGCGAFGVSCGGLQTLNLTNTKALPMKAIVLDAPVVDLHNDCYFNGDWFNGTVGGSTMAGVAWLYKFDYCDFDKGTYTINGTTYNFSSRDKTSLEQLWQLNKHRVENYNPYESGKFIVQFDGDTPIYGINFPCPVKMWFGLTETTNSVSIGQDFIRRCRAGGTAAEFRGCPTNAHGVNRQGQTTTFNGISGISVYAVEMIMWLSRWLGESNKNVK